jgi:hypothetical protein
MNEERLLPKTETNEEDIHYFFPYQDLLEIELPDELEPYEGGGNTSYKGLYDGDKIVFMNKYGIIMPDEWQEDRAYIVNGFIVLQNILAWERARRDGVDPFEYFKYISKKLNNERVDRDGDRKLTESGKRYEDYLKEGNTSNNPKKKITEEELSTVCYYILSFLKKSD